ncbi:MAG: deoxyhypusine synthase [archaeon]
MDKEKIARDAILKKSEEISGETVKGYDFNKGLNYDKLLDSFSSMGAQATNLARAVEIIKEMRKNKAYVYLAYTSNMISTGNREIIRYLVEHKLVDYLITTCGGVEEDFIKCIGDFKIGDFNLKGKDLRESGINRIGNILVPNSRYCAFEDFLISFLEKNHSKISNSSELIRLLGKEVNNKESVYYWAYVNNIPVHCPAIMDGSIGDMLYFYSFKNPDFKLDVISDAKELNNSTIGKDKTGMIILGGGVVKHAVCNANLYRNGADYAVYINTAEEFDASDAGARTDEAVSWGKIAINNKSVKVHGDATIIFPLIVAKAFVSEKNF